MRNRFITAAALFGTLLSLPAMTDARQQPASIHFTVSLEKPATQTMQVIMEIPEQQAGELVLIMPVWTPGYYQRLSYAQYVEDFSATDAAGNKIDWENKTGNRWQLHTRRSGTVRVSYSVKTAKAFVAQSWLDSTRGYLVPASLCLYPEQQIQRPVVITVRPFAGWKQIVTGLDPVAGKPGSFHAPDYDVLYDSPVLSGNLDSLPTFEVNGVPHYFKGYRLGDFDRQSFMNDLKAITTAAVDLMGDIPFRHYTFIGIGPGQGGIEHLNSTTVSFNGSTLQSREARIRVLNFLAHEYFHHYNAKRIRPFELGPFDYENGNRTNLLWIAEGLTVYYEYLILRRAGITTEEELLKSIAGNIRSHENREGKHYQSLVQASYETWSDGPFGRSGEGAKQTISYYDKGPVVGMLLDFTIRCHSQNKQSLDDVMRYMYKEYYQARGRGFTDAEFQKACEAAAGQSLTGFFEYIHTVKELDYDSILACAGLKLDRTAFQLIKMESTDTLQQAIWNDWSGGK